MYFFNSWKICSELAPFFTSKTIASSKIEPPSILNPKRHFSALTWTGDGSASRDITGLEFRPDLVWIKRRAIAQAHSWQDSVIGFGDDKTLRTETTGALDTNGNLYGYINYTLPDGININGGTQASNNDSRTNAVSSNNTYVAWSWKAGGSTTVTNNEGSVTSHVSANTDAGFSIVIELSFSIDFEDRFTKRLDGYSKNLWLLEEYDTTNLPFADKSSKRLLEVPIYI